MLAKLHLPQLLSYISITFLLIAALLQSRESLMLSNASNSGTTVSEDHFLNITPTIASGRDSSNEPVHISIDGIIDTAITSEVYSEGVWSISATSASHLSTSAYPGEPNNIIVYGHNKNSILGPIRWLAGDEEITVQLANGSSKVYTITEMKHITTDQVQYLQPTEEETLTVYTCSGPFDRDRFIVRAVPKKVITVDSATLQNESSDATKSPDPLEKSRLLTANPFLQLTGINSQLSLGTTF